MRVCFVAHDGQLGAVGRGILELSVGMRPLGVEAAAIVPPQGPLQRELRHAGVRVWRLPVPWWTDRYASLAGRAGRTLAQALLLGPFVAGLRATRCDVVYTHTVTVGLSGIAAGLCRVPHVWHIHEFGYDDHRLLFDFGFERAARLMGRLSTAVICVSRALRERYAAFIPPERLHVIYQSVTVRPDPQAEEEAARERRHLARPLRLIIVGEVKPTKGQEDAVRALHEIVAQGIDAELLVVGGVEGAYGSYLHRLAFELGVRDRVRFTGWVDNPYPLVRSSDVALMCSRSEAFGRVTVEAMLAGKPVIGARAGATPELVLHGFNGFLYEPADAKDLARWAVFLHQHPHQARQMGDTARRWASEGFSVARYAAAVKEVLMAATLAPRHGEGTWLWTSQWTRSGRRRTGRGAPARRSPSSPA